MAEQASKVSGVVQIDGTPARRTVRAYGYDATNHEINGEPVNLSRSLGHATSDHETGEYTIYLGGYMQPVFVVAFDDYGAEFRSAVSIEVGDRVHPTTPNGYVWECTGSGTLPIEEPVWVIDTETAQLYGTASMIARPFYRPMAHGPVMPESTIEFWAPDHSPETTLWFDATGMSSLITDPTGGVSEWTDSSGAGVVVSQPTGSLRPRLGAIGGQRAVYFNGANNVGLISQAPFSTPEGSFVISFMIDADSAPIGFHSLLEVDNFYAFSVVRYAKYGRNWISFTRQEASLSSGVDTYPSSAMPAHILTIVFKIGEVVDFRINGFTIGSSSLAAGTQTPESFINTLRIGASTGKHDAFTWRGHIGEIVLEEAPDLAASAERHEGYLAHKWGVAENLPMNHPYREAAPLAI